MLCDFSAKNITLCCRGAFCPKGLRPRLSWADQQGDQDQQKTDAGQEAVKTAPISGKDEQEGGKIGAADHIGVGGGHNGARHGRDHQSDTRDQQDQAENGARHDRPPCGYSR